MPGIEEPEVEIKTCAEELGLHEDAILPTIADWQVVPRVPAATVMKAQKLGLARITRSRVQYIELATRRILNSRRLSQFVTGEIAPAEVSATKSVEV